MEAISYDVEGRKKRHTSSLLWPKFLFFIAKFFHLSFLPIFIKTTCHQAAPWVVNDGNNMEDYIASTKWFVIVENQKGRFTIWINKHCGGSFSGMSKKR